MSFENFIGKEEIAQKEQLLILPLCFQLFLMIKVSFEEILHIFSQVIFQSSVACGKGLHF